MTSAVPTQGFPPLQLALHKAERCNQKKPSTAIDPARQVDNWMECTRGGWEAGLDGALWQPVPPTQLLTWDGACWWHSKHLDTNALGRGKKNNKKKPDTNVEKWYFPGISAVKFASYGVYITVSRVCLSVVKFNIHSRKKWFKKSSCLLVKDP